MVVLKASRCSRVAVASLVLLGSVALWTLARDGYLYISMLAGPPFLWLSLRRRDPGAGLCISCRNGCWLVGKHGRGGQSVVPERGGLALPWLFQLRWRVEGQSGAGSVWVFPDSAAAGSLPALRRCLLLAGR